MFTVPKGSPSERALDRLVTLTLHSDAESGNDSNGFDPWLIAEAELRLGEALRSAELGSPEALNAWRTLHVEEREAEERWQGSFMRSPMEKSRAAERVLRLRAAIEAGDGADVMVAVALCAAHGLVMPGWLSAAFIERYQRVALGLCKDWSDPGAFGAFHALKGTNTAGVRARSIYGPWAYEVACELLTQDPSRALDRDFYDQVGEAIGRSHAQAFDLLRSHLEDQFSPPLLYLRERLAAGVLLRDAVREWNDERFEAAAAKQAKR